MFSVGLYSRPTQTDYPIMSLTRLVAPTWQHTTRDVGGYWDASFSIRADQISPNAMRDFYERYLGCVVREYTGGIKSWEGLILEMRLVLNRTEHMRSLRREHWHNSVKVQYTYNEADYSGSEGSMAYDPVDELDAWQDDGQTFSDFPLHLGPELLDNTGFETFTGTADDDTNDDFGDWTEYNTTGDDRIEAVTSPKYDDSYAVKIIYDVQVAEARQTITVTGGDLVMFSGYCYGGGANNREPLWAAYDVTNSAYIRQDVATGVTTAAWRYVEGAFEVPSTCTSVRIDLYGSEVDGSVYWDDVSAKVVLDGQARYRLSVTNSDGSGPIWGFMGGAFTVTNTDDTVYIYENDTMTDEGWAVEGLDRTTKTPTSYVIEDIVKQGSAQTTAWASNSDAIAEYGEMEMIDTWPKLPTEVAEQIRDTRLAEYAWPRSRMVGGVTLGPTGAHDSLTVIIGGFWHTLNWRYHETSELDTAYDLVTLLIGESEFVTAGRIEVNEQAAVVDADTMPQLLGDAIEDIIALGDASGNRWLGGVYADKEFVYEEAPDTVEYTLRDGRLLNQVGVPVLPTLVKPGILVRLGDIPLFAQPPGTSNIWDDPNVSYIKEVEFEAPDTLRLRFSGEEALMRIEEQLRTVGRIE